MKKIQINENLIEVLSEQPLAHGGNQKCFELVLKTPISIQNIFYNKILCKKNLNSNGIDNKSITIFNKLSKCNIPTVKFMFEAIYENEKVLITENLNYRKINRIYVSSNYHPQNEDLAKLLCIYQNKPYEKDNNESSKEYYLSHHKLDVINNIENVLVKLKNLSKLCAENKVFFPEDAIFFGVDLKKQCIDDVLLGDYGSILIDTNECDEQINLNAIDIALEEFKMHFVK